MPGLVTGSLTHCLTLLRLETLICISALNWLTPLIMMFVAGGADVLVDELSILKKCLILFFCAFGNVFKWYLWYPY